MTPTEYLKSLGIDLKKTVLITYIDGVVRNPDLCSLLEGYKKLPLECDHLWDLLSFGISNKVKYKCLLCDEIKND